MFVQHKCNERKRKLTMLNANGDENFFIKAIVVNKDLILEQSGCLLQLSMRAGWL